MDMETRFSFDVVRTNVKAIIYTVFVLGGGIIGYFISENGSDNVLNMCLSLLAVITCSAIGIVIAPAFATWVVWRRSRKMSQKEKDECLYDAAADGDVKSVKHFLAIGADVNCIVYEPLGNPLNYVYAFGYTKKSPLDVAEKPEVRQLLLEHGAKSCPDRKTYYLN